MNTPLYTLARTNAEAVAPTLEFSQLSERINAASIIAEQEQKDSDVWTVAKGALDAFDAELASRYDDWVAEQAQMHSAQLDAEEAARDADPYAPFFPDDDPRCVCGTARSEHALCGCPDGFELPRASRPITRATDPRR